MNSTQAKQAFDAFIQGVENHVSREAFKIVLVDVQGFVDANWNTIYGALPTVSTVRQLVDGVFMAVKGMNPPLWLNLFIGLVQNAVDSYLQANSGFATPRV